MLKTQFRDRRPHLVGLQETRTPDTAVQGDADYLIFQAQATAAGSHGVALWISKMEPYAHRGQQLLSFCRQHCNVYSFSPRHITVCVTAPFLQLLVMVVHAPSAYKHPIAEVERFWQQRAAELDKRPPGADFVLLADANAHLGSIPSPSVGAHQPEEENGAGEIFHAFLQQQGAHLPATFEDNHIGPGHTWTSPSGVQHRLDYVVVPLSWAGFWLHSAVLFDTESLQKRDDHWPVYLHTAFMRRAPVGPPPANRRRAPRPPKPSTAEQRAGATHILRQYRPAAWHVDVDLHYQALADFWQKAGATFVVRDGPAARQPYLSPDTLRLVQLRRALRRYLKHEADQRKRCLLAVAFLALAQAARRSQVTHHQLQVLRRWWVLLDFSEAEALFRLYHLGHHLRKFVARDRAAYLRQLADNVHMHDLSDAARLFESVRKAFPSTRRGRHSIFQPLPAVQSPDGKWAMTPHDRLEVWRTHFARQEAGVAISPEQYLEEVARTKPPTASAVFDVCALPSLREVEALILGLRRGRAAGSDAVSSELLQLRAPLTATQLMPVFLKAGLGLREPVLFRGGELVTLAKKAGAAFQTCDFRSILISSVPGKIYHRKIRERILHVLGQSRHPLHSGAFPGEGIERICLAAKTFQLQCEALHHPWALTFVDLQSAFYQVVREAVAPCCSDDAALLRMLHSLDLPQAAYHELRHPFGADGVATSSRSIPACDCHRQ